MTEDQYHLACVNTCIEMGINRGCYGMDWNHASNPWNGCRCWLHPQLPGDFKANPNVDHYEFTATTVYSGEVVASNQGVPPSGHTGGTLDFQISGGIDANGNLIDIVLSGTGDIVDLAGGVHEFVWDTAGDIVDGVADSIDDILTGGSLIVGAGIAGVGDLLDSGLSAIGLGVVGDVVDDVFQGAGDVVAGVGDAVGDVVDFAGDVVEGVGDAIGDVGEAIGDVAHDIFTGIGDFFGKKK